MGFGGLIAAFDKRYRRMRKILVEPDQTSTNVKDKPEKTAGATA